MTTERDTDSEPTVEIQRPAVPQPAVEIEDVDQEFDKEFDPERTLVREDWESTAIRRVAPHVAAVQDEVAARRRRALRLGERGPAPAVARRPEQKRSALVA